MYISEVEGLVSRTIELIEKDYEIRIKVLKLISKAVPKYRDFFVKENTEGLKEFSRLSKIREEIGKQKDEVMYNQLWDKLGGKPRFDIVYDRDIYPYIDNYHKYFKMRKELRKQGFWERA